jgi:Phosphatidylserine/phosphatidylglycerophosphate/cardiolipin synthases and related enzymes
MSTTAPLLMSLVIGFIMGFGVMYYFSGTQVITTTASVPVPVTITSPVTTTKTTTLIQTTRTTALVTTPVTVTATVTNTATLERISTTTERVTATVTATVVNQTTVVSTLTRTQTVTATATVATTATVTTSTTVTTTTTMTVRPEMTVCFSRTEDCASIIEYLIGRANLSVYVAVYVFTNPSLADALVNAKDRGVRVIVIVERNNENVTGSQVGYLRSRGVEVVLDENPYLMHHKFAIIDGEFVIVGSYNWSLAAENRNDESLMVIRDRAIASEFEEEFARMLLEAGYS